MAGKPKPMSQIKQLLHLHNQGAGKKHIARALRISRNTVKAYLEKITDAGWTVESLLALEDHELERYFHPGSPAYKDDRFTDFSTRLDYFVKELPRPGVTRFLLWEEYRQARPDGYGYSQFCELLGRHMQSRKPGMVLTHHAGEKLFFDFAGKPLEIVDRHTGEITPVHLFVACLPYSDYGFAMALPTQQIQDVVYALVSCLSALGGVPRALVPDNMKTAVVKANRYEPDIHRVLEDLANHYGMSVSPTRPGRPKDKALVENQVKLIYQRVYAKLRNQIFYDLESLNKAIAEKVCQHNQTRMQQKPYSRQECFLSEEKPLLKPLPGHLFEIKYSRSYKVAQNNHIYLGQDKHYYSVPHRHIGKHVQVIYTRSLVRIFADGLQLAAHPRDTRPGRYTTTREHLCSEHQHYLKRSPDYYLNRALRTSGVLHELFEHIFDQDRYPETLYKTCDGLLALSRKTDPSTFARACKLAIEHENYSYKFIDNLLKNNMTGHQESPSPKKLPKHGNVRGAEYFQQTFNF